MECRAFPRLCPRVLRSGGAGLRRCVPGAIRAAERPVRADILFQMWGRRRSPRVRNRDYRGCMALCVGESRGSFCCGNKEKEKSLDDLRHIRVHKSVAAFALAICLQTVIAQGLGTAKYSFLKCMAPVRVLFFRFFRKIFCKKVKRTNSVS